MIPLLPVAVSGKSGKVRYHPDTILENLIRSGATPIRFWKILYDLMPPRYDFGKSYMIRCHPDTILENLIRSGAIPIRFWKIT